MWDYPRPPAVEPTAQRVRIELAGVVLLDSTRALRVLETSHPPVYYLPYDDVLAGALTPTSRHSFCEFKGSAAYYRVSAGDRQEVDAAWHYPRPAPGYELLAGHVAFYPGRMDRVTVDGEPVQAQEGGFYGGWVTAAVVGPFKGGPGTAGW